MSLVCSDQRLGLLAFNITCDNGWSINRLCSKETLGVPTFSHLLTELEYIGECLECNNIDSF